jgi:hypothetical protein
MIPSGSIQHHAQSMQLHRTITIIIIIVIVIIITRFPAVHEWSRE